MVILGGQNWWGQVGIFDRRSGDFQPETSGNTAVGRIALITLIAPSSPLSPMLASPAGWLDLSQIFLFRVKKYVESKVSTRLRIKKYYEPKGVFVPQLLGTGLTLATIFICKNFDK